MRFKNLEQLKLLLYKVEGMQKALAKDIMKKVFLSFTIQ